MSAACHAAAHRAWPLRYVAAVVAHAVFLFPIYWLFMISFKTPDEIYAFPPVWYPASIQFDNYRVLFKDGDASTVWNSLVIAGVEHGDRDGPRHDVRLQPRALQDRRRATSPSGSCRSACCRRSPSCSRSSCSTSGSAGRHLFGLILLYTAFTLPYVIWMMRGYIQDIPLELEEAALVDGCTRWQVLWQGRGADGARRPVRRRRLRLRLRLERVLLRAGADAHRGHHLHGAGDPLFRRPVELLGEDRRHVGARHRCRSSSPSRSCSAIWCAACRWARSRVERHGRPQDHRPAQVLRRRPCGARHRPRRSPTASSPCWSARRAAARARCCAPSPGSRRPTHGTIEIGGEVVNDLRAARPRHRHGVPELRALPVHDRVREHRLRPARAQDRRRPRSRRGCERAAADARHRRRCSTAFRASSPAASASASPSAAPSCATRSCSCSTSRCPTSTRSCATRCAARSSACTRSSARR